jgi:hypothetical protein
LRKETKIEIPIVKDDKLKINDVPEYFNRKVGGTNSAK